MSKNLITETTDKIMHLVKTPYNEMDFLPFEEIILLRIINEDLEGLIKIKEDFEGKKCSDQDFEENIRKIVQNALEHDEFFTKDIK